MNTAPPRIGNDVVDLAHPRTRGKDRDARFLVRVFTEEERAWIRAEGAGCLWALWAAKEAAYKVACKAPGTRPPFGHRSFRVELPGEVPGGRGRGLGGGGPDASGLAGVPETARVTHGASTYAVRFHTGPGWVHAVAGAAQDPPPATPFEGVAALREAPASWREELEGEFTAREWAGIHSFPSAQVRILARRTAAEALGVPENRLEITREEGPVGRTPPLLVLNGRPAAADLSLSHHGRWVAWSVALR